MATQPYAAAVWLVRLGMTQSQLMADPYPIYDRWQQDNPIWEVEPGQWMMFRYQDVRRVLSEPEFGKGESWSQPAPPEYPELPELTPSMLMSNPPDHTRLRALVNEAFQPRHLDRLRPYIEELAEQLASRIADQGGGDLVRDFAFPLPAQVIAELLGVPRADHSQFRDWSQSVARLLDPSQIPVARQKGEDARWELLDYFHHLIARKRQDPGDDLLSELIAVGSDANRLSAGELLSMALLLLVAGHETTTNLLSMGTLALIEEKAPVPEQSWHDAVEELLRYTSPVQLDARLAREAVAFDDITVQAGDWVTVVIGAANRDAALFAHPHRLDLARRPNPHLAFGRGIHFCLGAGLARLEATLAFPILWRRRWRPVGQPLWNENIVLRGLTALPAAPQ